MDENIITLSSLLDSTTSYASLQPTPISLTNINRIVNWGRCLTSFQVFPGAPPFTLFNVYDAVSE